jgi:carboxymethylenebutenolidase
LIRGLGERDRLETGIGIMIDPRPTTSDFPPEVLSLFQHYVHGTLDRRGFLDKAAKYATGGATAAGFLAALSPNFAAAQQVPKGDARLKEEWVEFASPQGYGKGRGYLVRPAAAAPAGGHPLVLVIHENRGLNPHIEDVARRCALAGFVAFAPDALHAMGGYPGNEDDARSLFQQLDQGKTREDMVAAAGYLKGVPGGNGKMGAVGFCWGGGMTNYLATRLPELAAAVPFYGPAPALDRVPMIRAPLMLVFAADDEFVNKTWPPYEAALKAADKTFDAFSYAGTLHGFHNDTTPRYNEGAAKQVWERTVAFFNRHLRTAS